MLSNNGSLGLSDLIVRQLGGDTESFTSQSFLRSDTRFSKSNGLLNEEENKGKSIAQEGILISTEDRQTNDSSDHPTNTQNSLFSMPQRAPSISKNDHVQNEKLSIKEVKIDKSKQNLEQNMSDTESKKSKLAIATLKMPDGKEVEIPLPPKVFKTGREGFYAQISAFVYDDEVYGGQIQVWKKTPKSED